MERIVADRRGSDCRRFCRRTAIARDMVGPQNQPLNHLPIGRKNMASSGIPLQSDFVTNNPGRFAGIPDDDGARRAFDIKHRHIAQPFHHAKVPTKCAAGASGATGAKCSGLMPSSNGPCRFTIGLRGFRVNICPPGDVRVKSGPSRSTAEAPMKFIPGDPMNAATNLLSGRAYRSSGMPTCAIRPAFSTTVPKPLATRPTLARTHGCTRYNRAQR